jgi:Flp pilus assembly protein TadD
MLKVPAAIDAGIAAHRAGRMAEARGCYEQVLRQDPENSRALFLFGTLHAREGRTAQAITLLERCTQLQPTLSVAHNALGCALLATGDSARAAAAFRRAIECPEPCVEAFCNLGAWCRGEGQLEEAVELYRRALAIKPSFVEVWCNLGVALKELGRLDEAIEALHRALALKPDSAEAHFNEGLLLLLKGDYRGGWPKHEYRWATEQRHARRNFSQPLWLGETPLDGQTILIHAEQGLGDTLQFVRYVPLVVQKGAKVVLEVQPALKTLLAANAPGIEVLSRGERLPAFDVHCPLFSLPRAFSTDLRSIPGSVPYLAAPALQRQKWSQLLPQFQRPRVGVVWFGNRQHRNDANRSIPPAAMQSFVDNSPVSLYCLQKDIVNPGDAALAASSRMIAMGERIHDFSDTAVICEQLDLVISVDTSVAHLSGALGRPLWLLLPAVPDWRWLMERDDTPWYPTARLFRQSSPRDWETVLRQVRRELASFCLKWQQQRTSEHAS